MRSSTERGVNPMPQIDYDAVREVAESYEEYLERAAKARGEGQIP